MEHVADLTPYCIFFVKRDHSVTKAIHAAAVHVREGLSCVLTFTTAKTSNPTEHSFTCSYTAKRHPTRADSSTPSGAVRER